MNLSVYDIQGKLVKTLFSGNVNIGIHSFEWDAANQIGQAAPAGIYFYSLHTDQIVITRKMVLMK